MAKGKKSKPIPPRAGEGQKGRDERVELFCLEFVKDRNASRAARAAGYSEHSAGAIGYELLTRPQVKKRISDLTAEHFAKVLMSGEEAMKSIQVVGRFDPRRMFDKSGCVLPPDEWPDDVATAIAGFEVRETFHPLTGKHTGYVKKVKLKDGLRAVEDIARHKGALKGDGETTINIENNPVDPVEAKKAYEEIDKDC